MSVIKGENKFFIGNEHSPDAELTYYFENDQTIVADHTFVCEDLRGQGVAGKLFDEFIDFVIENDIKVIPTCSYVKVKMMRSMQYNKYCA